MILADAASIAAMLGAVQGPAHKGHSSAPAKVPEGPRRGRSRSCACRTCARCLENAKWERIYTQRFEDPDYYKPRALKRGSSLSW